MADIFAAARQFGEDARSKYMDRISMLGQRQRLSPGWGGEGGAQIQVLRLLVEKFIRVAMG